MTATEITTVNASVSPAPGMSREFMASDSIPGTFASLMAETRRSLSMETDSTVQAPSAGAFGENQKQHQRYMFRHPHETPQESVNSAGTPSEKRQDAGTTDFSQNENDEQRFSEQTSAFHHQSGQKERKLHELRQLNNGNNEIISAHASTAAPQQMTMARTVAAASLLSESEMKKLVRVLRSSSLSKRTSVFLTLDLKELGEVKLDVRLEGKKIFITAHITDRRSAAALSYAIGELRKKMAEIDLTLERFEFSSGNKRLGIAASQSPTATAVSVHTGGRR
jgi:hypothetical protein